MTNIRHDTTKPLKENINHKSDINHIIILHGWATDNSYSHNNINTKCFTVKTVMRLYKENGEEECIYFLCQSSKAIEKKAKSFNSITKRQITHSKNREKM